MQYLLLVIIIFISAASHAENMPSRMRDIQLSPQEAQIISDRIFQNECAGKHECLVSWNEGEAFPSLGIGHFIWYPQNHQGPFFESFPALIDFFRKNGVALPHSIANLDPFEAPWPTRDHFLAVKNSESVTELRAFLAKHQTLQVNFMVTRCVKALQRIVASSDSKEQQQLTHKINAITASPLGLYPLIDYVNFKGEGLLDTETYQSLGWGLKQVLQHMPANVTAENALSEFAQAAKQVLWRRVNNAANPLEKSRWYPAWENRINTYTQSQI